MICSFFQKTLKIIINLERQKINMNSETIISVIAIYFLVLYIISYLTGKDDSNNVFLMQEENQNGM